MAKNFNSLGQNVEFELGDAPIPSTGAVKSGDPIQVGSLWGVALEDELVRDGKRIVVAATEGVYLFEMETMPTEFGTEVFLNDGKISTTAKAESDPPFGVFIGVAKNAEYKDAARIRVQQVSASGQSTI